jgi:hypothetical protein
MGLILGFILQAFHGERGEILQKIIAHSHENAAKIFDFMRIFQGSCHFSGTTT